MEARDQFRGPTRDPGSSGGMDWPIGSGMRLCVSENSVPAQTGEQAQ